MLCLKYTAQCDLSSSRAVLCHTFKWALTSGNTPAPEHVLLLGPISTISNRGLFFWWCFHTKTTLGRSRNQTKVSPVLFFTKTVFVTPGSRRKDRLGHNYLVILTRFVWALAKMLGSALPCTCAVSAHSQYLPCTQLDSKWINEPIYWKFIKNLSQ